MSRRWIYLISLLVLISLISGAFFAPELIMEYGDRSLLEDYTFQSRTGIDYEAVNTQYTMSREERMISFAQGIAEGRQYYITSSGEEVASWADLFGNVFNEYFFDALYAAGIAVWNLEGLYDSTNVKECQYYVIYDNDMTNGAAFLCWYLELELSECFLRLLVDARDYSIYYLEYYENSSAGYSAEWLAWMYVQRYENGIVLALRDYYGHNEELYYKEKELYEEEYRMNLYDGLANEEYENIIQAQKQIDGYVYGYNGLEYMDDEGKEITVELLYEGGSLRLDICLLNQRIGPSDYGFRMGIQELFELLPEEIRGTKLQSVG